MLSWALTFLIMRAHRGSSGLRRNCGLGSVDCASSLWYSHHPVSGVVPLPRTAPTSLTDLTAVGLGRTPEAMALRNLEKSSLADHSRLLTEAIYCWQMTSVNTVTSVEKMGLQENLALCALLDAGRIALVEVNSKRQVWSAAAERIFGWHESEVIGRSIGLLGANRTLKIASPPSLTTEFPKARSFAGRRMVRLCLWRCGLFRFAGTAVVSFWRSATRPNRGFLEHAFLDAADREQRRIGKEMHDHLCRFLAPLSQ